MPPKRKVKKESACCPFCEAKISEESFPFCQACKVKVMFCPECKKPISREDKVCPHCGESFSKSE